MSPSTYLLEELHQLEEKLSSQAQDYILTHEFKITKESTNALIKARNQLHEHFIPLIGEYNRKINQVLQKYNQIDFVQDRKNKILQKAVLSYCYNFLELCMKILRLLEEEERSPKMLDENISLLIEFSVQKEILLESRYFPKAEEELEAFYDNNLRKQLDSNLKKFLDKHQRRRER